MIRENPVRDFYLFVSRFDHSHKAFTEWLFRLVESHNKAVSSNSHECLQWIRENKYLSYVVLWRDRRQVGGERKDYRTLCENSLGDEDATKKRERKRWMNSQIHILSQLLWEAGTSWEVPICRQHLFCSSFYSFDNATLSSVRFRQSSEFKCFEDRTRRTGKGWCYCNLPSWMFLPKIKYIYSLFFFLNVYINIRPMFPVHCISLNIGSMKRGRYK